MLRLLSWKQFCDIGEESKIIALVYHYYLSFEVISIQTSGLLLFSFNCSSAESSRSIKKS